MIEAHTAVEIGIGVLLGGVFVLNRLGFIVIGRKKCSNNKCPDPECQECVRSISQDMTTVKSDQGTIKEDLGKVKDSVSFIEGRLEGVKIIQIGGD